MSATTDRFYVTTPIYYVNDRPHIGHVYTTTVADVVARYRRLAGQDVFFLTGTDEHAAKVTDAAAELGMAPLDLATRNSDAFRETFERLRLTNDDFIRTTQERHTARVTAYVEELIASGDIYTGEYEGWYDAGQEEYVPETKAREADYRSPVNGKPLVRKREENLFFRLSAYADRLVEHIEAHPECIRPDARRNEVLARIREGLHDVPMSRTGTGGWGIPVPGRPDQTIYVWIDALFNYLTTVDTDERRSYWPADVHYVAKDILWFHAVVWPAVLLALRARPGYEWVALPRQVYVHSYWVAEGQKMSKSLKNFIEVETLDRYVETFGRDALRWYLATQGPLGTTDADFAHARFVEVYNADLANTFGNCLNRVCNMTGRYFGGTLPARGAPVEASRAHDATAEDCVRRYVEALDAGQLAAAADAALDLVRAVDGFIEETAPFRLAKDPDRLPEVATILHDCAEALRIASVCLWPFLPEKVEEAWRRLGCEAYADAVADRGRGRFAEWTRWGLLEAGTPIAHGEPLFPRHREE